MTTWSPSRLRLLAQCGRRYQFRYVVKLPDPSSREQKVGLIFHIALERIGRAWLAEGPVPGASVAAAALEAGRAVCVADGEMEAEVIADALALIRSADRDILDLRDLAAVEEELAVEVDGIRAVGRSDRIDLPDDSGPVVRDYKTGVVIPDREAIESDPQTLHYLAAARRRWPDRPPPRIVYHYIRRGIRVGARWSEEMDEAYLISLRAAQARLERLAADDEWPASVSGECERCPYRARCSAYRAAFDDDFALGVDRSDVRSVVEARQRAAAVEKLAEARKRELSEILRPIVDGEPVLVEKWRVSLRVPEKRSFPSLETTARVISRVTGEDETDAAKAVGGVDIKRLDAYLAELGGRMTERERLALEDAVEATGDVRVSPHVRVDPIKNGPFG